MRRLFCVVLVLAAFAACNDMSSVGTIPSPYRDQIQALKDNNIELMKKCQDLQKQQAELVAQQNWNINRMNLLAGQAVTAAGLSPEKYSVDVDLMKIKAKGK